MEWDDLIDKEGERLEAKRKQLEEIEAVLARAGYKLEDWAQFLVWRDRRNGGNGHNQASGIELVRLASIDSVPLRWLWPGKIPMGKLTLLVGDPGLGKSVITLDLAARVSMGAAWPDGSEGDDPGDVIIFSAEDDAADTIRPHLEIAGADLDRIFILKSVKRSDGHKYLFSLVDDLVALKECIDQLGGSVHLVVIDPISAYLGNDVDSHNNTSVRAVLAPLAELAAMTTAAFAGVSHLNKGAGTAIYRIQGSIAFTAAARAVWAVAKDPHDETGHRRLLLPVKNNLAPDSGGLGYEIEDVGGQAAIHWGEAISTNTAEALEHEGPEELSGRQEATEFLKNLLQDGAVAAIEVFKAARACAISEKTLKRAKKEMGIISEKADFGGGWFWRIPGTKGVKDAEEGQEYYPGPLGPLGDIWPSSENGQKELIENE